MRTKEERLISDDDWRDFFEGRSFKAGVDFPVSLFYK